MQNKKSLEMLMKLEQELSSKKLPTEATDGIIENTACILMGLIHHIKPIEYELAVYTERTPLNETSWADQVTVDINIDYNFSQQNYLIKITKKEAKIYEGERSMLTVRNLDFLSCQFPGYVIQGMLILTNDQYGLSSKEYYTWHDKEFTNKKDDQLANYLADKYIPSTKAE